MPTNSDKMTAHTIATTTACQTMSSSGPCLGKRRELYRSRASCQLHAGNHFGMRFASPCSSSEWYSLQQTSKFVCAIYPSHEPCAVVMRYIVCLQHEV